MLQGDPHHRRVQAGATGDQRGLRLPQAALVRVHPPGAAHVRHGDPRHGALPGGATRALQGT